jgi:hypothetical protein
MSIGLCTGPEMGPAASDGALHVRNTRPESWLATGTSCVPAVASDLYKDADLGLWVPPVEFGCFYERFDSGQLEEPVGFGDWFTALSMSVPSSDLPASACSGQQFIVVSTFTINATVPQNAGMLWCESVGPTAPPAPNTAPPVTYPEHGRFKGWADSALPAGTTFFMARTDTLQRLYYFAAGTDFTLYQWLAVLAYENGTGAAVPTVNRVVGEMLVYAFDAASGYTIPAL